MVVQRLGIRLPLFQAPMAGAQDCQLAIAIANGGGLGAIPCSQLSDEAIRDQVTRFRSSTPPSTPINLNFFCHPQTAYYDGIERNWTKQLEPYYTSFKIDTKHAVDTIPTRYTFDQQALKLVQDLKPEVVSFHFGVPAENLVQQVHDTGAFVMSSATTVEEASYLESRGCDAIIAQGSEAGGHRGMFLATDVSQQVGTMSLLPGIVDEVNIPVIAAGGFGDSRGMAAAFALGASAIQMGTLFLRSHESLISSLHKDALSQAKGSDTAITNVFSSKPARSIVNKLMREHGPMSDQVPPFPYAVGPLAPLKKAAESNDDTSFSSLWSGQSPQFAQDLPAIQIMELLEKEYNKIYAI